MRKTFAELEKHEGPVLELPGLGLGRNFACQVSAKLGPNKLACLTTVNLADNVFGANGLRHLSRMLSDCKILAVLDLSRTGLKPEGARLMAEVIQHPTLHTVRLSGNGFGDEGIFYFIEGLTASSNIRTLLLDENNVTAAAAKPLGIAFGAHIGLRKIDLSGNHLGDTFVDNLSIPLRFNPVIRELRLANMNLSKAAAQALAQVLTDNPSLRVLDLRENPLGDLGASHLAAALCKNIGLRTLSLASTRLTDVGAGVLCTALQVYDQPRKRGNKKREFGKKFFFILRLCC